MRVVCFLVVSFLLSACEPPLGDIQSEYSRVARQTGIVPVFPPKEDVQVGDIFALSAGGPNDILREWIGEDAEVAKLAIEYMNSRIVFRETINGSDGVLRDDAGNQTDTYGNGLTLRSQQRIESLPIEALPFVTADAGAAFGFGRANPLTALGAGFGQRTTVRLDFGDVRAYGIPRVRLTSGGYDPRAEQINALKPIPNQNINWIDLALGNAYQQSVSAGRDITTLEERCSATILVTKVYLTRKIEFTFLEASGGGLSASRIESGATSQPAVPDVPPVNVTITQVAGSPPKTDTAQLETAIDAITTEIQKIDPTNDGRATGLTFEGFTALGATFSKTYQRPVVVGYEGWPFFNGTSEEDLERCQDTLGLSR